MSEAEGAPPGARRVRIRRTRLFWTLEDGSTGAGDDGLALNARFVRSLLLGAIPPRAASLDASRMMVLMFCVNSLDVLGAGLHGAARDAAVEWVYARQSPSGGFLGSSGPAVPSESAHLTMTYSALLALVILGDHPLGRVDREKTAKWLGTLQREDGSFTSCRACEGEADARFVYSACAVSFILQNWSGIDVRRAVEFLLACQNQSDGGFGLRPGQESHGGATYTCLASLKLLGALDALGQTNLQRAVHFCVMLQDALQGGFSGRPNKPCDTCYAYWLGGSLRILGKGSFLDRDRLAMYLDTTWHPLIGGYGKEAGDIPDVYHTHLGICAHALALGQPAMEMTLGMTMSAYRRHFGNSMTTARGSLFTS